VADVPGLFKYAVVEIETVEYAQWATTALLTGDAPVQVLRTLVPDGQIVDTDSAAYTFQLAGPQASPLYAALIAAAGTVVDVVFQTEHGAGKAVRTFSVTVPPAIAFGGPQGQFRTFDLQLPVTGAVVASVSS
jgi:hypothetical protein